MRIFDKPRENHPEFVHRVRWQLWITPSRFFSTFLGAVDPLDLLPRPFPGGENSRVRDPYRDLRPPAGGAVSPIPRGIDVRLTSLERVELADALGGCST
jgi:hypothetical protein